MKKMTDLERLKLERDNDTEWLGKYKKIVDGLTEFAYINFDAGCDEDWGAMAFGLGSLSKLIQEDLDSRKEVKQ